MNRPLLAVLLAAALTGCAAKSTTPAAHPPLATDPRPATAEVPASGQDAEAEARRARDAALTELARTPVHFALDSATLTRESQDHLERLATGLRERPQARVRVAGHTCDLGTTEYNLALGQRRAAVVRDHLARLGVERERISVVSYGEESPADEGTSDEARAHNRRAELSVQLAGAGVAADGT